MTAHNPLTEKDLEEAFEADPEFGIRLLYEDFKEVILRYIKREVPGLQLADWLDIFQETMIAFFRRTQEPEFDHRRPLALVYHIAKGKAYDACRRKKHRPKANSDALVECVAKDLQTTKTGMEWRLLSTVERDEFRQAVQEIISTLPERQRVAAQVYADNFEDMRQRSISAPLAQGMSDVLGEVVSVVAAKSAWQEARKKIAKELSKRGFRFVEAE